MRNIRRRLMAENAARRIWMDTPIRFEDEHAKALCVGLCDSDGDGEVTPRDMAGVRTLTESNFRSHPEAPNIVRFHEFRYFTGLTKVVWNPFFKFSSLEEITFGSAFNLCERAMTYLYINKLKRVVFLEGITSIGNFSLLGAFDKTAGVVIKIPTTVKSINTNALGNNSNLTFVFRGLVPPAITNGGYALRQKQPVYVPDMALEAYRAAPNILWFGTEVRPVSEYVGGVNNIYKKARVVILGERRAA
ncbi:hypothetical protein [Prevotella sp. KH2C16]|uniref:hypothetical protein n=1 Tax=Prevotella sp. KH2C16 TaxID=1855325 RepID=UPI0008E2C402|nr:hypothetical protein [Prevotella sp. KH2C16]SFG38002.1 hypothetical protein SAMN05216383_1123 [Prevotella sp. KH2C16]SFG75700.1 hypothetical protein SAMN05216383_13919 [Prevotella sp. KH2C16]